ncbi:hypothetical protein [Pseudonocardia humida]|uniref:Uncharacterized protein n=1 Tax=Pseudonocardia humida TaxID=2800819 RepID=A0ABT1A2H0_9PSEU|nr:hypothetical protein [Pseudonocardia humida]MCO1657206.1 hypothetical protein [Pseudonocardia humida]
MLLHHLGQQHLGRLGDEEHQRRHRTRDRPGEPAAQQRRRGGDREDGRGHGEEVLRRPEQ